MIIRKAMVPQRDDCPVTGIVSKANFVTSNAVDTILAVPRSVGLPPVNYLEKEDYGKVPQYLEQVMMISAKLHLYDIHSQIVEVRTLRRTVLKTNEQNSFKMNHITICFSCAGNCRNIRTVFHFVV